MILSSLLFSLSFNMDNMIIGTAYGLKKIKIGIFANLIIAAVTSAGTYFSMSAGKYIANYLPGSIANTLGAAAVGLLGLYYVIQSIIKWIKNTKPKELALKDISDMMEYAKESDLNCNGNIDKKEAFLVGLGLMLNNLGTGVSASMTNVNIPFTVIVTFFFSIVTLSLGQAFGENTLGTLFGKYAPLFSGLLLIALGIFQYCH